MAANYGKLEDVHRERIWQLRRRDRPKAFRDIAADLRAGDPNGNPPRPAVEISHQAVGDAFRRLEREREELFATSVAEISTDEGMELVVRRLLLIADRETQRLLTKQRRGQLDPRQLAGVTTALDRIRRLRRAMASEEPEPASQAVPDDDLDDQDREPTLAEQLAAKAKAAPPITAETPRADAPVPTQG